jgi:Bacteriophage tail sheath protein
MPSTLSYPGVYVEELPSGVRTIAGVSTSNTAFVDFFARGPMNAPQRITSFGDFERIFGGLDTRSEASYAIKQYYLNGGSVAFVVRAASGTPARSQIALTGMVGSTQPVVMIVEAAEEGAWGDNLQVAVDYNTAPDPATGQGRPNEFNLVVREVQSTAGRRQVVRSEILRNLSIDQTSARYAVTTVPAESQLVRVVEVANPGLRPDHTTTAAVPDATTPGVVGDPTTGDRLTPSGYANTAWVFRSHSDTESLTLPNGELPQKGQDGDPPNAGDLVNGVQTLDRIEPEIFNILCVPRAANLDPSAPSFDTPNLRVVVEEATQFCHDKRAFLIVDIPASVVTAANMMDWLAANESIRDRNAAVYFPRLLMPDPLLENRPRNVGPSGTLAGLYAATDAARGVWKAPAGTEAGLVGVSLAANLTDLENGGLNPFGINALRTFPVFSDVVWGARTLDGADIQASEWKYIPVRRTALFLEESLFEGLKWVVFEPNDDALWAQIRLNVGAFMHNLFVQGAFQGNTPAKAYFVKCDAETTTQNDIDLGVVNVAVGFAPLKPAEFVVIQIQQIAGQIQV